MEINKRQKQVLTGLAERCKQLGSDKIVYQSEWLGYLPYGQYQWVSIAGNDITEELPSDFTLLDLESLVAPGFLFVINRQKGPEEDYERIEFQLNLD